MNTSPSLEQEKSSNSSSMMSFEAIFARLEKILEQLNSGAIGLDDSLILYEEADQLIVACTKRLTDAEEKIEKLVKNRNGELILDHDDRPKRIS